MLYGDLEINNIIQDALVSHKKKQGSAWLWKIAVNTVNELLLDFILCPFTYCILCRQNLF